MDENQRAQLAAVETEIANCLALLQKSSDELAGILQENRVIVTELLESLDQVRRLLGR